MTHVRPRMSDLHKLFVCALTATALAGSITSAAFAQPDRRDGQDRGQQGQYDNLGNRDDRGEHRGWGQDRGGDYSYRRGQRMGYNDWHNAPVVAQSGTAPTASTAFASFNTRLSASSSPAKSAFK